MEIHGHEFKKVGGNLCGFWGLPLWIGTSIGGWGNGPYSTVYRASAAPMGTETISKASSHPNEADCTRPFRPLTVEDLGKMNEYQVYLVHKALPGPYREDDEGGIAHLWEHLAEGEEPPHFHAFLGGESLSLFNNSADTARPRYEDLIHAPDLTIIKVVKGGRKKVFQRVSRGRWVLLTDRVNGEDIVEPLQERPVA